MTSKTIRYCTARLASIFNTGAKSLIPFWGKDFRYSNKKIKEQLGIKFRSGKESVIAMAYSLIESGIVPNLIKKKAGK